jgi:hypothetical protein
VTRIEYQSDLISQQAIEYGLKPEDIDLVKNFKRSSWYLVVKNKDKARQIAKLRRWIYNNINK